MKTNAEGEAEFSFTPEREGYYRVAWSSPDKGARADQGGDRRVGGANATTELGYRHGGVEIIVDKDTFRAGQKAPVMLHAPGRIATCSSASRAKTCTAINSSTSPAR